MAQTINVDMTPGLFTPTIHYSQGDIGTQFAVDLRSRFGDTLPDSPTITIQATKPSGFGFIVSATSITDGLVIFTTVAEMTDEAGRFPAELKVVKNDVTFYTANFWMVGEATTHPDGTTDGQAGSAIPILTLLVERIEAAADSIHNLSVEAETLAYNEDATATYDGDTNKITFGIPRGGEMAVTDPDSDGNIVITFS